MDNQTREYAQQNFSLPHDVVPLPSGGIFYKNKKKTLKVGYLTAADENLIMAGGSDMTFNLLRSKIYEPDVRIEELMEGDVEAILIFLRNTSFGPEIELSLTDPLTKKPFKATVVLDQLPIRQNIPPLEDGTYLFNLPKTGYKVKVKPLTYGEALKIQSDIDSYPKGVLAPRATMRLEREILEIDGNNDRGEISRLVNQLPIADSKYIRKFLDENEPKLDLRKTVKTPSGESLTVNVGFGVDFFRPFF